MAHDHPTTVMSLEELAQLGGGEVAYTKIMPAAKAQGLSKKIDRDLKGVRDEEEVVVLFAADGTPLTVAYSEMEVIGDAIGDDLEVVHVH